MEEKRLDALEEKLSYLEMTNGQLKDEIFRQQKERDMLTKAHRAMHERIEVLQDNAAERTGVGPGDSAGGQAGERPPHY